MHIVDFLVLNNSNDFTDVKSLEHEFVSGLLIKQFKDKCK